MPTRNPKRTNPVGDGRDRPSLKTSPVACPEQRRRGRGKGEGRTLTGAEIVMLGDALQIAGDLKKADPEIYADIFAVVKRAARFRAAPSLILEVITALKREHDYGHRPRDLWKYWHGTARRIRQRAEAQEMRANNAPSPLGDILNRAQAHASSSSPSPAAGRGKGEGKSK